MKTTLKLATLATLFAFSGVAHANDHEAKKDAPKTEYVITLKGTEFEPKDLVIPADTKVEIIVKNATDKAMEFESHDFDREKVIPAGKEAKIKVGPLKAGSYGYFNEFHEATKGTVTAK